MSTRGAFGFFKDGVTKVTYNHSDSYPEGLGMIMIDFLKNTSTIELHQIFDKIILVEPTDVITDEMIKVAMDNELVNLDVSDKKITDMYCLFRALQYHPELFKIPEIKWMINGRNFIDDSLFCEWVYIINLDTNELEIYEGYQKVVDENYSSRYYDSSKNYKRDDVLFYPVSCVLTIPFHDINSWDEKRLCEKVCGND